MTDFCKFQLPATVIKPKPVMVFFYGGGFDGGTSSKEMYGPDYLINHDVILVTFNYRIGALGKQLQALSKHLK